MSDVITEARAVVIDNGTGFTKVGFSSDDKPKDIFPTIVGIPKFVPLLFSQPTTLKEVYVGHEALRMRGLLKLIYPMEHGIIKDWDAMEQIWRYIFRDILGVNPARHPVLLTEPPLNPRSNREKMAEIMFETFKVPALYIGMQALLSAYAVEKTTALILDIGDGTTHAVPIYNGFVLVHAIRRSNLGGRDVTDFLARLLVERGLTLGGSGGRELVRTIKEKVCYVALDPRDEIKSVEKMTYELPDGSSIEIEEERFMAPEVLFTPGLIGKDVPSVQEVVFESIMACDMHFRKPLFENIVLSGGTTLLPGLRERLQRELKAMLKDRGFDIEVNIIAPPDRQFTVWKGGSKLASLPEFRKAWITREEYEENPAIIHRVVARATLLEYFEYLRQAA